jgi:MOSC domain-containing protein YiiM
MFQGELLGIYLAERKCAPLQSVDEAEAVPGRGLMGDRYYLGEGTYSAKKGPDREVTLIEIEALQALRRESDLTLDAAESRRNLLTHGVPLNHLVGQEFTVGAVRLRGLRLCEPCGHLERLTRAGVNEALCHRGGLRAQVVEGGMLHTGDSIQLAEG